MEIRHLFPKEALDAGLKPVEHLYLVKSGILELLDQQNEVVAVYGPKSVLGMSEILRGGKIVGTVIAQRSTSVVAIDKAHVLDDLSDAEANVTEMLGAVVDTVGRRSVMR